jgi:predicted RNA-binding Zn-ribbon protein involved in translation (DUF1610 family)
MEDGEWKREERWYMDQADLVLTSGGYSVYYKDTTVGGEVSYQLYGMRFGGRCPECGGRDLRDRGSYDKCMECGMRITLEYVEAKIISSG